MDDGAPDGDEHVPGQGARSRPDAEDDDKDEEQDLHARQYSTLATPGLALRFSLWPTEAGRAVFDIARTALTGHSGAVE